MSAPRRASGNAPMMVALASRPGGRLGHPANRVPPGSARWAGGPQPLRAGGRAEVPMASVGILPQPSLYAYQADSRRRGRTVLSVGSEAPPTSCGEQAHPTDAPSTPAGMLGASHARTSRSMCGFPSRSLKTGATPWSLQATCERRRMLGAWTSVRPGSDRYVVPTARAIRLWQLELLSL